MNGYYSHSKIALIYNCNVHEDCETVIIFFFQAFHDVAYSADSREELLLAINEFLEDTLVLPPGNWDRSVLLPILIAQSRAIALRRKLAKAGKNIALYYNCKHCEELYRIWE